MEAPAPLTVSLPAEPEPDAVRRRAERGLALLLLALAIVFARSIPLENERRTLALLDALGARRLAIDPAAPGMLDLSYVPPVGQTVAGLGSQTVALGAAPVDPATRAGPGHYYAGGPPGLAFTLAPFDEALRRLLDQRRRTWALTVLGAGVPLALAAVIVRRAARATGAAPEAASLAAAAFGLGTIALPFGAVLYAHSIQTALLGGALLLLLGPASPRRAALAGALAAWAVVCDYSAGLQACALLAFAGVQGGPRAAAAFCLGATPAATLLAAYHTACFEAPWRTPYDFRADLGTRAVVQDGAWGFTFPRPGILLSLLFGDARGVLFTQPVALVAMIGLGLEARARRRPHTFALVVVALTFLANAARAADWTGGLGYGPRYAVAALPFLALGLPRGLALLGRAGPWAVGLSATCAGLGAVTDWGSSVLTSVDFVWLLGPRAPGLELLLLGPAPLALWAALVGAAAVVVLAPAALWITRDHASRGALLLSAALSFAIGAHGVASVARAGARPDLLRQEVGVRELARAIEDADSLEELQRHGWRASQLEDPTLLHRAIERALELEAASAAR